MHPLHNLKSLTEDPATRLWRDDYCGYSLVYSVYQSYNTFCHSELQIPSQASHVQCASAVDIDQVATILYLKSALSSDGHPHSAVTGMDKFETPQAVW